MVHDLVDERLVVRAVWHREEMLEPLLLLDHGCLLLLNSLRTLLLHTLEASD